jgi:hypothetical protein
MDAKKANSILIERLKPKVKKITLIVRTTEKENRYFNALRQWENDSTRKDLPISGPINA